jgi:alpha/beta superfamily hydrolase
MPKDVVVPDIAEWYQKRGFTALIFDTFGIGASDGEPRHEVSRPKLTEYISIVS